jgi:hypothetical protein
MHRHVSAVTVFPLESVSCNCSGVPSEPLTCPCRTEFNPTAADRRDSGGGAKRATQARSDLVRRKLSVTLLPSEFVSCSCSGPPSKPLTCTCRIVFGQKGEQQRIGGTAFERGQSKGVDT